jgi:hypothetical protein
MDAGHANGEWHTDEVGTPVATVELERREKNPSSSTMLGKME